MKNKVSKIVSKILMAAVGVVLIAYPGTALVTLIRFLGAAIALIGIFGIISYIAAPYKGVIATLLCIVSTIALLASIIPIAKPSIIVAIFPLIIGIAIAIHGISNVFEAIALKAALGIWFVPMVLSLLTVAAGCVIAFYPFSTMDFLVRTVGVILVYNAVVGLFMAVTYKPKVGANGVIDITENN